jgi:hypothetical protein
VGADFHLDDALNGVFDIALRESWTPHPALDENQLSTTVTLRSQTGRQFECRVPQPNVAQTTAEEDDAAPKFDPLQVCAPPPFIHSFWFLLCPFQGLDLLPVAGYTVC